MPVPRLEFLPPPQNRIYESNSIGVSLDGSQGRVEGCQIWGNELPGVVVQEGSDAVVVGCKCAGDRARVFCWRLVCF